MFCPKPRGMLTLTLINPHVAPLLRREVSTSFMDGVQTFVPLDLYHVTHLLTLQATTHFNIAVIAAVKHNIVMMNLDSVKVRCNVFFFCKKKKKQLLTLSNLGLSSSDSLLLSTVMALSRSFLCSAIFLSLSFSCFSSFCRSLLRRSMSLHSSSSRKRWRF